MAIYTCLTRYNLVSVTCAVITAIACLFLVLSFIFPWVIHKEESTFSSNQTYCNYIFPQLHAYTLCPQFDDYLQGWMAAAGLSPPPDPQTTPRPPSSS